jgi:hypothetical protein
MALPPTIAGECDADANTYAKILNKKTNPAVYDKMVRPSKANGVKNAPAEPVAMNVYISQFYGFNEKQMNYKLTGYFRQTWVDKRLAWKDSEDMCWDDVIEVPPEQYESIWRPDTYFGNAFDEKILGTDSHRGTAHGRTTISQNGTVFTSSQLKLFVNCPMNFARMPFDKQYCPIVIEGYWSSHADIEFIIYGSNSIEVSSDASVDGFSLVGANGVFGKKTYSTGSFPLAHLEVELKRDSRFQIVAVIIPAILFVTCSYLSFWIDRKVAPARVAICLLPLLIIVTVAAKANDMMPRIDYSVWMSDFMITSLVFACVPTLSYLVSSILMMDEFEKNQTIQKLKSYEKACRDALKAHVEAKGIKAPVNDDDDGAEAIKARLELPKMLPDPDLSDRLKDDVLKECRKIFNRIDKDVSDSVDIAEMTQIFKYLHQRPTKAKMERIFREFTNTVANSNQIDAKANAEKRAMGTSMDSEDFTNTSAKQVALPITPLDEEESVEPVDEFASAEITFEQFLVFMAHSGEFMTRNVMTRVDGASIWDQPQSFILEKIMRIIFLPLYYFALIYMFSTINLYDSAESMIGTALD